MRVLNEKEFELSLFVPFFGAIGPFLVWPIEFFLPYPFIIEEIYKTILVFLLLPLPLLRTKIKLALIFALLFSFTETVFYLFNILASGDYQTILLRILFTTPMHIVTTLVILLFALKDRRLIIVGVIFAGLIHYSYNHFMA